MTRKHIPLFSALLCALLLVPFACPPCLAATEKLEASKPVNVFDFFERYISDGPYFTSLFDISSVLCLDFYPSNSDTVLNVNGYLLYDPVTFDVVEVFIPFSDLSYVSTDASEDRMTFTMAAAFSELEYDSTYGELGLSYAFISTYAVVDAFCDKLEDSEYLARVKSSSPERFCIYSGNYDYYMQYFDGLYTDTAVPSASRGYALCAVLRK